MTNSKLNTNIGMALGSTMATIAGHNLATTSGDTVEIIKIVAQVVLAIITMIWGKKSTLEVKDEVK